MTETQKRIYDLTHQPRNGWDIAGEIADEIDGWRGKLESARADIEEAKDERDALTAQLAAVEFAAHMPTDYKHGLPSWINQYLYAGWIGAKISPHIMGMIEGGTLTFPNGADAKRAESAEAQLAEARAQFVLLDNEQAAANAKADRVIAELETQLGEARAQIAALTLTQNMWDTREAWLDRSKVDDDERALWRDYCKARAAYDEAAAARAREAAKG